MCVQLNPNRDVNAFLWRDFWIIRIPRNFDLYLFSFYFWGFPIAATSSFDGNHSFPVFFFFEAFCFCFCFFLGFGLLGFRFRLLGTAAGILNAKASSTVGNPGKGKPWKGEFSVPDSSCIGAGIDIGIAPPFVTRNYFFAIVLHQTVSVSPKMIKNIILNVRNLKKFDASILVTDHDNFDYNLIKKYSKIIVDCRNRFTEKLNKIYLA